MAKPKKEAKRAVEKVSKRKGSGDKKIESPAGSGRGVAEVRKSAKDPKRNGGAHTTSALHPVGEISVPVTSELAKILGSPDIQITPQQLSLPVYGNYCGFGHGDPTGKTPPIDAVDAVCRAHDLCYRLLGDFDRQCDRHFFSLAERNLALGETLVKRT